ncbi:hypothetical protein DAT35_55020 [Vitiosangium sp. GDMCC 1.1324]|nr:hypothetical protein DAT35_55020 [Vitiosangium sp. GDMCC 1.1324]
MTPFQAHWLVDYFHGYNYDTKKARTERNTRMRLQRLAKEGFIRGALTHPEKGGFSGIYYRLAGKGLRVLGIPEEKNLLRAPAPPVLRYLLLRNEVYARAREDNWTVLSPLLTPEKEQAKLLQSVRAFLLRRLTAQKGRSEDEDSILRRPDVYLPPTLTFECLIRYNPLNTITGAVVLLVVDDIRRAIVPPKKPKKPIVKPSDKRCQTCGGPMKKMVAPTEVFLFCITPGQRCPKVELKKPSPPQFGEIPLTLPGAKLLLRDTQSVYDVREGKLARVSPRLRVWRRALEKRFGKDFLATDNLFPDVWAQRTNAPMPAMPDSEPAEGGGS